MWKTEFRYMNKVFQTEKCTSFEPTILSKHRRLHKSGSDRRLTITSPTTKNRGKLTKTQEIRIRNREQGCGIYTPQSPPLTERLRKNSSPSINSLMQSWNKKNPFEIWPQAVTPPKKGISPLMRTYSQEYNKRDNQGIKGVVSASARTFRVGTARGGIPRDNMEMGVRIGREGIPVIMERYNVLNVPFRPINTRGSFNRNMNKMGVTEREVMGVRESKEFRESMTIREPEPGPRKSMSMKNLKSSLRQEYIYPLFKGNLEASELTNTFLESFHRNWQYQILQHQHSKEKLQAMKNANQNEEEINPAIEAILNRPVSVVYPKNDYIYAASVEKFPILSCRRTKSELNLKRGSVNQVFLNEQINAVKNLQENSLILKKEEVVETKAQSTLRCRIIKCLEHLDRLQLTPKEFLNDYVLSTKPYERKRSREFINACKHGKAGAASDLIFHDKFLVYEFDHMWQTGLIWGSKRGHDKVVEVLIKNKVDVNAQDSSGRTAIYHAALNNHLQVVKLLLYGKADPNIACKKGIEPRDLTTSNQIKAYIIKAKQLLVVLKWTKGLGNRRKVWNNARADLFHTFEGS